MRQACLLTTLMFSLLFVVGCSRHAAPPAATASPASATASPASASASPASATASPAPSPPKPSTYLIHFERTPCMGRCPAYVVDINPDGTSHYTGGPFAWKTGEATFQLKPDVVKEVLAQARQMKFAQMPEDVYGHGMMDAPSAILIIQGKTVKCTGGECPQELKDLHHYLDTEIQRALGVGPEDH